MESLTIYVFRFSKVLIIYFNDLAFFNKLWSFDRSTPILLIFQATQSRYLKHELLWLWWIAKRELLRVFFTL